jgi:hypothetical protein
MKYWAIIAAVVAAVSPVHAEKVRIQRILQMRIAKSREGMFVTKVMLSFKDPVLTPVAKAGLTKR